MENDFVLSDFTPEVVSGLKASGGGAPARCPIGDYRLKITNAELKAKEGANPHNMLKITFQVIAALSAEGQAAIGHELSELYAGSRQSPAFMQRRLKQLLEALKIVSAPSKGQLIGRELDATVVWELSKPTVDASTGEERRFVNDRVKHERGPGAARPANINPQLESTKAMAFLTAQGWEEGPAANGASNGAGAAFESAATSTPPWAPPQAPIEQPVVQDGFKPETEADTTVHQYRAAIAMNKPGAADARNLLLQHGFNPDGPIDVALLPDAAKTEYIAFSTPKQATPGGLPPLTTLNGGKGPTTGTRARK